MIHEPIAEPIVFEGLRREFPWAAAPAGWRDAGTRLAHSVGSIKPRGARLGRPPNLRRQLRSFLANAAAGPPGENLTWLLDNVRLIFTAEKEVRDFALGLREFPVAVDSSGEETPRVRQIAREYLQHTGNGFCEEDFIEFLWGYQTAAILDMREIWALKPALQLELLHHLTEGAPPEEWPALLTGLRRIGEATWKDLFETVSQTHHILARDPSGDYTRMDFESRSGYRAVIAEVAKHSGSSESDIAETAITLTEEAAAHSDGSPAAVRRAHVGFYLVDQGRSLLEARTGYRPPLRGRLPRLILRHPTAYYLASIELLTLLIVLMTLYRLDSLAPAFAGLVLLLLPATQAAVHFVNTLTTFLVPPHALPKLDFSEGIPDSCVTMAAVPALLLNEAHVRDLVLDLEIRFLANRDPNLYFALLTDSPDSDRPWDQRDALANLCRQSIEALNRRYQSGGHSPFFLLHRHRAYNESEGRWMGWERKRGKLLDLNRLLRSDADAFPLKVGDLSVLPSIRYVITLDSDTQLPRDSAARLIGAMAHPLNRPVVDPATKMVVEGYGILQPRIGIGIQSAVRSRLAALYSGQTGFDIYTRAVSNVYQDLFGEGIFTGKGIYDVDAMRETLEDRFPENALLSHDLIEGAYARAALVSDIELIDDYPTHFSAYSRRNHRWVRGDWQIMQWIKSRVPDRRQRTIPNPISLISQWKILDNLRRSLLEPALVIVLLGSWLYLPGVPAYWTLAIIGMLFIPAFSGLLFAVFGIPGSRRALAAWARQTVRSFVENMAITVCSLIFLLHQALLAVDAIGRSVLRVLVTRRKLLEWETAAESGAAARPKAPVDIYLEWTPFLAAVIAVAIRLIRPAALPAAAPILGLWAGSRAFASWLNRRPRAGHCGLNREHTQLLRDSADRIWRFFHDWSSSATNWLIPDSVREDGVAELRLSPTNLGMLLNARIAAVHLGLAPLAEFVFETRQTLDRVLALPKYRGHLFNWYDMGSLEPLAPRFVSTVDSGNLAASLWTLKQAALTFAGELPTRRGLTKELAEELAAIAEICDRLVREMDFRFLYRKRKKALSIGYNAVTRQCEPSCYTLLASEARIACFVAIAKGDIPQEAWFHLGRVHTLHQGESVLLSWTGTMFEYLMPALWMRHHPGTITERSIKGVVQVQREYARRKGIPWGISESACLDGPDGDFGYEAFGIPVLAMKRTSSKTLAISPYSSFLAASVEPAAAMENLLRMQEFGWTGRYGFYEAIDYTRGGGSAARTWMAHHQGMSLLAIVNLLFDNPVQQYFHAEPQVLATELLLHERVPASALAESDALAFPELAPAPAPAEA